MLQGEPPIRRLPQSMKRVNFAESDDLDEEKKSGGVFYVLNLIQVFCSNVTLKY